MTELSIDIHDKTFAGDVCAIRELKFNAPAGQFTAIVGPSGAGKSTLLNIVAGLIEDFNGSVSFNGQDHPRIGFMFQESRLLPWLSVRQNIELVIRGLPENEQAPALARIPELLDHVDLKDFEHSYPRQLSIGMQRRVSLVRAFVIQPDLLLMDEPFQSLDRPTAMQMRKLLLDLWQETRSSVLFVTHSLREALLLADRVLFLSPRPARVVLDVEVDEQRPRQPGNTALNRLHDQLMEQHPELLSGSLNR